MPEAITINLDTADFEKRIRTLSNTQVPRVLSQAMNKVAFDVSDAEADETARIFKLGSRGKVLFARKGGRNRSFRIDFAKPESLEARIYPAPIARPYLEQHHEGEIIGPRGDVERLEFRGKLAVPIDVKRGARGKVPKRMQPSEVIKPGRRGFVAGNIIGMRIGKKRLPIRVLYALKSTAKLEERFEFYRVARDTVRRQFPVKFHRVLEKIRG